MVVHYRRGHLCVMVPLADTQEGYVLVHVDQGNNFRWEYIDYGWNEIKE
ncbi:MAG: hypothetical protein IAB75_02305 [Bacteroidetes bacterium]|uniref:Uncharacterized protein n=1 Tax=Candidatus Cryptobacteroides avicola TaxID=2840757 RepID=A0A940DQ84_9BACT|nr:hypothetical protein [Candidatus Cryptobacteroides avicola]